MPSGLAPGTLLWAYFWAFLGQEVPYQGGTWYRTTAKPERHFTKGMFGKLLLMFVRTTTLPTCGVNCSSFFSAKGVVKFGVKFGEFFRVPFFPGFRVSEWEDFTPKP